MVPRRVSISQELRVYNDTPFSRGLPLARRKAIYIEDSTFNSPGRTMDCWMHMAERGSSFGTGTAVVNAPIGWHGAEAPGYRGVSTIEVYRNTFSTSKGTRLQFHRSGTGVSFDNTYTGIYAGFNLSVYRARTNPPYPSDRYHHCDGTSPWDGNVGAPGAPGWPCLDQTGYTFTQNSGGSYTWNPLYAWKNTNNGVEVPPTPSEVSAYLVENRDFFAYNPSFDGTRGVGVGLLASRPSTCTTGVAYWATDRGSWNTTVGGESGMLYRCTATNKWSLYYKPYTYPHPLQALQAVESDMTPPATPTTLTLK